MVIIRASLAETILEIRKNAAGGRVLLNFAVEARGEKFKKTQGKRNMTIFRGLKAVTFFVTG